MVYLIILFVINNIFVALAYYFSLEPWPAIAIEIIILGNLLIGYITRRWHENSQTGEYLQSSGDLSGSAEPVWGGVAGKDASDPEWYKFKLKNLASLFEIIFYTALFLFNQILLIAGWLILKSVSHYSKNEASGVAILRIGTLLSLGVALIAAVLFSISGIKETQLFEVIRELIG